MKGIPSGFENNKGRKEILARCDQTVMTSIFVLGLILRTAEGPETITVSTGVVYEI